MKLAHFSGDKIDQLKQNPYLQQEISRKPHGFWISVEDSNVGWKDWCEREDYGSGRLTYEYEIELHDEAQILVLSTIEEIDLFHERFRARLIEIETVDVWYIDWRRVAEKFQGIIISPYQHARRLDLERQWYYTWDCASGCIWDVRAIKSIRLLNGEPK